MSGFIDPQGQHLPPVAMLAPTELQARLITATPVVLLDVREEMERTLCRIDGSHAQADLHIPLGEVPLRVGEIQTAASRGTLVVYCHHGIRSMVAARWLSTQDIPDVANLDGGIDAWSAQVDPTVPRY